MTATLTKTKGARHARPVTIKETQRLMMIRCVTRTIGAKKYTFWQTEGCAMHIGRGCHMKAMSDAVRTAPVVTVTKGRRT